MSQFASEQLEDTAEKKQNSQQDVAEKISLVELLLVLSHWKRRIIGSTLAFTLFSALIALLIPNRYTASTSILPPQNQSIGAALLSQVAGGSGAAGAGAVGAGALAAVAGKDLGLKNPNDNYVAMLGSRRVEDAIINKFDLRKVYRKKYLSDARRSLEGNSEIKLTKEGLINISVEDKDPSRSESIANFYVEQLQKLTSELALSEAGQRRIFLQRQIDQEKNDLAAAEVALKETQQRTGLLQLDNQSKVIFEAVGQIRARIAETEVELHSLEVSVTRENPEYLRVQQRLNGLRMQLAKIETQQTKGEGDLQVPTGKLPEMGLEYARRLRDLKYHELVFEFLAKQLEVARIDEAREGAIIQVVDRAERPDQKSWPKMSLVLPVAFGFGLVLSVLVALAFYSWSGMKNSGRSAKIEELRRLWIS